MQISASQDRQEPVEPQTEQKHTDSKKKIKSHGEEKYQSKTGSGKLFINTYAETIRDNLRHTQQQHRHTGVQKGNDTLMFQCLNHKESHRLRLTGIRNINRSLDLSL